TLTECLQVFDTHLRRTGSEKPDYWHRRLLAARRKRPRCRAAEQRDELAAPHHSMTSSASASRLGGISRPSAFSVLRLITSSNLVGRSTGKSEGFSPLRIRPTYVPACRCASGRLGP